MGNLDFLNHSFIETKGDFVSQFRDFILDNRLPDPESIISDGEIHRFGPKKTCWYVAYDGEWTAGVFGDWKKGSVYHWKQDKGLSIEEKIEYERFIKESKKKQIEEKEKKYKIASEIVKKIWDEGLVALDTHPYLLKKKVSHHHVKMTVDNRLMIPLYNRNGDLTSIQYIDDQGNKRYHKDGEVKGSFFKIGDIRNKLYLAEGFATAATIHEVTGDACIVSFSAGNLSDVCKYIRESFKHMDIVIVADNDESGVGMQKATEAAKESHCNVILIPEIGDANDYFNNGNDLKYLLEKEEEYLEQVDDFSSQPAPIEWMIDKWLPENGLCMVHGPSGSGKTFVVLDWCLRIASELNEWSGYKVDNGGVVYLAGEGHHGLKSRIKAWCQHYNVNERKNMWVSKSGCDLNTPEGYMKVINSIKSIDVAPKLIVVDTLHRFLVGDESSAQDAKTMLDYCSKLMTELGCSVMLVHHTGISGEAQYRARGSSAWKGALDAEINIQPKTDTSPIVIKHIKAKDDELMDDVYIELQKVYLKDWYDRNGNIVSSVIAKVVDKPDTIEDISGPRKIDEYLRIFERSWFMSECETKNGYPYVSRSVIKRLLYQDGLTDNSINAYLKPSRRDLMIGYLLNEMVIHPFEHGWIMCNELYSDDLLSKNK